jgi:hypothetical protein
VKPAGGLVSPTSEHGKLRYSPRDRAIAALIRRLLEAWAGVEGIRMLKRLAERNVRRAAASGDQAALARRRCGSCTSAAQAQPAILAAELCTAGMWQRVDGGYRVLDTQAVQVCVDRVRELRKRQSGRASQRGNARPAWPTGSRQPQE